MFFMLNSSLFLLSYCSALFLSDSRNNHPKSSAHACCTGTTIRGRAFLSSTAIHLSTDNNRPDKFRVVTPESLSSLFGANSIPSKCNNPSSLTSDSLSDDSGDSSTAELEERDNSFEDSEFMDESLSITDVGDEDASDIDVDVNIDADSAFASENGTKNVRRVGRYIQIGNTAQSGSKIRTKVVSPSPGAAVILGGKDDGVGEGVRVWLNREPLRYTPALGSDKSASIAVPAAISSASKGSPSNHFQSSSSRATIRPLVSPDSALSDGVDLDGKLDNTKSSRVRESISMREGRYESRAGRMSGARGFMGRGEGGEGNFGRIGQSEIYNQSPSRSQAPRVVSYDPKKCVTRPDPMLFGAYRRWKDPGSEESSGGSQSDSEDSFSKRPDFPNLPDIRSAFGAGSRSGAGLGGQGRSSSRRQDGGKGTRDSASESFYKAIRSLGSGPAPPGSSSSSATGLAEPNDRRVRPVQPQKAPTGKNRKRTITPDEISNLFGTGQRSSRSGSSSGLNEEDEENERAEGEEVSFYADYEEDGEDGDNNNDFNSIQRDESSRKGTGGYGPFSLQSQTSEEEFPQWLIDANREGKRARSTRSQPRRKRTRQLTDDWRFWAAVIASSGFLAALYTVYQQTGGFGSGLEGGSLGGGSSGTEMII